MPEWVSLVVEKAELLVSLRIFGFLREEQGLLAALLQVQLEIYGVNPASCVNMGIFHSDGQLYVRPFLIPTPFNLPTSSNPQRLYQSRKASP